jgi:hypothetical protein
MTSCLKNELLDRIQQQVDMLTGPAATESLAEISHASTDRQCRELGQSLVWDLRSWRRLEHTIRSDRFPSDAGEVDKMMMIIEMIFHDSVG